MREIEREREVAKEGEICRPPIHFILILRYNEHELKLFGNFMGVLFIKSSVYVFKSGVLKIVLYGQLTS